MLYFIYLFVLIQEYEISPELLPSYIPLSLCQKILFIGQAIVMISNDPRDRNAGTYITIY